MKKVNVALIQLETIPGEIERNLNSAHSLIESSLKERPDLILLPEMFSTGYLANENLYRFVEEEDGNSINWLKKMATNYGVHIGGGVVIREGDEIYNRFYIVSPKGEICGYSQKNRGEAYCFRRGKGFYVIETDFGRVGAPICADSHFVETIKAIRESDVDFLVMPHAWATMINNPQDVGEFNKEVSSLVNRSIIFVNGVGPVEKMKGIMGSLMPPSRFRLRGRSMICDYRGTILEELGCEPGVLTRSFEIERGRGEYKEIPDYGGWIHPGSALLRRIIIPIDIFFGKIYYKLHKSRVLNNRT